MMRFARRNLLLVAFFVLASAAPAYADSWVAWIHKVFLSKGIDEWTPAGAAETLDECRKTTVTAAGNAVRKFRAQNEQSATFKQEGPVIETTFASGEKASLVFVCLPDTVDPRGPKGNR
jgi:hypothetical protein